MIKKTLIAAAALLLLGAGCAPAAAPTPSPSPVTTAPSPNASATGTAHARVPDTRTVKFTKSGTFDPAPVAIHVGGTVTWQNDSNQDVWVASTPYPTHADYPGFDSKVAIKPGASWSFTFDKAGQWLYINNLQPSVQGRVDVTPWP